nr:hypothetical protein [Tanacetum cinerariifolium]
KPSQATKGTRLKTKAKVAKSNKKKEPPKKPKDKGLAILSKVALTEAEQLKLATKRSEKQFHSSHASGSGDGVDTQSKVLDEQHLKTTGADEGIDEDDVHDFNDMSDEGDDDNDGNNGNDGDDDDANDDDKQESDDKNDDDEETDSDRTDSDRIKILVLDDKVTKELYDDVNVNFGNEDTEMTNADQVNNEIASLMDTTAHHATTILEITSSLITPTPIPPPFFNPLSKQATPTPTPTASETTTSFPALLDFASLFKLNERVTNLEKDMSEIKQVDQEEAQAKKKKYIELVDSTAAATLSEFELTKILIDKIERNKSYDIADHKRKLYNPLVKSYQIDKDLFDSYGKVFSLKRSRDDGDKDRDPSVGSYRETKREKSSKDVVSSRDSRSKEKKSSSTSKDASQSQHKSSDQYRRKRLMRTDELYKFSDGTLNDVRSSLHDIAVRIRMEYLPMRK